MGQTQTNIKARTQHTAQSALRREQWQKPDSFWHDYFLWTFLDKSYKGYCCDKRLKELANQNFLVWKEAFKAEAYFLTWVLLFGVCVRTWARPVSGTHLGRVGICQWVYSDCTGLYCTVQCGIFAGVSVLCVSPLWQCSVLPSQGVTREKSFAELMSIKTHTHRL